MFNKVGGLSQRRSRKVLKRQDSGHEQGQAVHLPGLDDNVRVALGHIHIHWARLSVSASVHLLHTFHYLLLHLYKHPPGSY